MPSALDTTVGGTASNSFLSLAEFATLADNGPLSAVHAAASTDDRTRALLQATERLTRELWTGVKVTQAQKLAWPRNYAVDPDSAGTIGGSTLARPWDVVVYLPTTTIPDRIRSATAELALLILQNGGDLFAADDQRDVVRARVDVIEVEYRTGAKTSPDALQRWPRVWKAVEPLLDRRMSNQVVRA